MTARGVLLVGQGAERVRFELPDRAVVGRDSDSDVVLRSRTVSRKHALIERTAAGYQLRDLGSGNGTLVGGHRVTEWTLEHGDVVEFGEIRAVFQAEEPAAAPEMSAIQRTLSQSLSIPRARSTRPRAVVLSVLLAVVLLGAATAYERCTRRATLSAPASPAPSPAPH